MSAFLSPLDMRLVRAPDGMPLLNRDGRQLFMLLSDFIYKSDVANCIIRVPSGFITDLASVPQALLGLIGDCAQEPSVPHDFIYSTGVMTRKMADDVLYEACIETGVPVWKARLIYAGVRVGGGSHFGPSS